MREAAGQIPAFELWTNHLLTWLDRSGAGMLVGMSGLGGLEHSDGSGSDLSGRMAALRCRASTNEGLEYLRRAVAKGYFAAPTLAHSRHFDALRGDPAFRTLLAEAEAGRQEALASFRDAGGERLLLGR